MRHRFWILLIVFVGTTVFAISSAQDAGDEVCQPVVEQALDSIGNNCASLPRNTACYGFQSVDASFSVDVPENYFSQPADQAKLRELTSIETAPLNTDLPEWGVALLNVQANVPNTLPGQAVTFVLMGDTQLRNAVSAESALEIEQTAEVTIAQGNNVNVRSGPNQNTLQVGTALIGSKHMADAVTPDGWVRIIFENQYGWIRNNFIEDTSVLADLPTLTDQTYTPMQAFYFTTGIGATSCQAAPDLLVVQSPDNLTVDLTVNGANIALGSTLVMRGIAQDYGTTIADAELVSIFQSSLLGAKLDPATSCIVNSIVTLDGLGSIDNSGVGGLIPLGHEMRSITCLNEAGEVVLLTPWRGLRRLSQPELAQFETVALLPLPKTIDIPTDQEIDDAYRRAFPPTRTPTPTFTPTPTWTPTPRPADPQPTPEKTEDDRPGK